MSQINIDKILDILQAFAFHRKIAEFIDLLKEFQISSDKSLLQKLRTSLQNIEKMDHFELLNQHKWREMAFQVSLLVAEELAEEADDPISLASIAEEDKICLSSGHFFDIKYLLHYLEQAPSHLKNPLNNQSLSIYELEHIIASADAHQMALNTDTEFFKKYNIIRNGSRFLKYIAEHEEATVGRIILDIMHISQITLPYLTLGLLRYHFADYSDNNPSGMSIFFVYFIACLCTSIFISEFTETAPRPANIFKQSFNIHDSIMKHVSLIYILKVFDYYFNLDNHSEYTLFSLPPLLRSHSAHLVFMRLFYPNLLESENKYIIFYLSYLLLIFHGHMIKSIVMQQSPFESQSQLEYELFTVLPVSIVNFSLVMHSYFSINTFFNHFYGELDKVSQSLDEIVHFIDDFDINTSYKSSI